MKKSLLAMLPFLTACAGEAPQNIGIRDGRLIACPESPNCVSSYESSEEHSIAALDGNLNQIQQVLIAMDGANIVEQSSDYLYAEFTSYPWGRRMLLCKGGEKCQIFINSPPPARGAYGNVDGRWPSQGEAGGGAYAPNWATHADADGR
jgi:hypothetical protein